MYLNNRKCEASGGPGRHTVRSVFSSVFRLCLKASSLFQAGRSAAETGSLMRHCGGQRARERRGEKRKGVAGSETKRRKSIGKNSNAAKSALSFHSRNLLSHSSPSASHQISQRAGREERILLVDTHL